MDSHSNTLQLHKLTSIKIIFIKELLICKKKLVGQTKLFSSKNSYNLLLKTFAINQNIK